MKSITLITHLMTVFLFCASASTFANINNVNVSNSFKYKTQKTVSVDIQVKAPVANQMTGLSFYSKGPNGLRLLDTRRVNSSGHYQGKLVLPTYLKSIVVRSRLLDQFKQVTVSTSNYQVKTVINF